MDSVTHCSVASESPLSVSFSPHLRRKNMTRVPFHLGAMANISLTAIHVWRSVTFQVKYSCNHSLQWRDFRGFPNSVASNVKKYKYTLKKEENKIIIMLIIITHCSISGGDSWPGSSSPPPGRLEQGKETPRVRVEVGRMVI